MRVLRPILACCLALLWLPLTMHCQLEAMGVWVPDPCGPHVGTCTHEACPVVEEGDFTSAVGTLKIAAPGMFDDHRSVDASLRALRPPRELRPRLPMTDPPSDWVREWPFVRRAAGLPRAPALNA